VPFLVLAPAPYRWTVSRRKGGVIRTVGFGLAALPQSLEVVRPMRLSSILLTAVGLLGLSSYAHAQFFRNDVSPLEKALRRRNTKDIFALADEKLAIDPDDADAQALRGAAFSIEGWPTEAVVSFELALGGDFYEQEGQRYHAEALRELGRGLEAAQLRRERRLVETPNQFAYIGIEANIVDDLRWAGAYYEAQEAAVELLATDPQNAIVHSTVAELAYELGDVDEAMFQLFLAARTSDRSYRYQEVLARITYDEGLLDASIEHSSRARKQRPWLARVRALQLTARCEVGEAADALIELDFPRFRNNGSPQVMAAEIYCRMRNGEEEVARALMSDLVLLAPNSQYTRFAREKLAELESAN